jgi:hypothetical protein
MKFSISALFITELAESATFKGCLLQKLQSIAVNFGRNGAGKFYRACLFIYRLQPLWP